MTNMRLPKDLVKKYPGKRVAIVAGRVVAVSADAKRSYALAKEKYPQGEILIYLVPRKEERYHLFLRDVLLHFFQ